MPDSLSPEFRLLLVCALPFLNAEETDRLRQEASACGDWSNFIKLVRRHRLDPIVGSNIQQYAADLVPSDALTQLKEFRTANQQQAAVLTLELAAVGRAFSGAGIPVCPLKGPWLAQRLYGSPSLRLSDDLDLLVAPESILAAEKALLAHGYERTEPAAALSPRQWQMYCQINHHAVYKHPRRGVSIEIHWGIATRDWLPLKITNDVLARAHPETFAGQPVLDLSTEDLITFLLIHGVRHHWAQLKWLADIAIFLRQNPAPDWQIVRQRLVDYRLERTLALGFLLCERWFGLPTPLADLHIQEKIISPLVDEASRLILAPVDDKRQGGQLHRIKDAWYRAKVMPSWRKKIGLLWHAWFIHHDWVEFPLPDWLFPLYIFLRPFLWLRRYHWPRRAK